MIAIHSLLVRPLALATLLAIAAAPVSLHAAKRPPAPKVAAAAPAAAPGPTPEQLRAQINAEQAAVARQQLDLNTANQKAYDEAVKARDAEIARVNAEYEAAMKKWKEDTAACTTGDTTRCGVVK